MKDAVLHNPRQSGNLLPKHRYHDLQDLYLQVGQGLVEKALDGDEIYDPLERSLVKDLKEMMQSHDFQTKTFPSNVEKRLVQCLFQDLPQYRAGNEAPNA